MTPLSLVPLPWKIGAVVVLAGALFAAGSAYHRHVYQQGYDQAVTDRDAHDLVAVVARVRDNAAVSIKQDTINAVLTRKKNEELAPVVARVAAERVRVGTAICPVGPATAAEAESAAGGDSADPPGRLVRPDVERDLRALKLAVEEDLATGRACQGFLHENGLEP